MEAKARSFTFLANEGIVKIPFFQRSYIWIKDNWEDLLDELLNPRRSHFLGSLILKQQRTISGDSKELMVIDGQQRLTTLSILLKALYDSFSENLKENCIDSIRTYLFHKRQKTDPDYLIKIQHSYLDSQAYQTVIRAGIDENPIKSAGQSSNKILQCYKYFTGELRTRTEEERKGLFNKMLDSENKMIVVIDLTEEDDEQTIFDTINSAGVRLTSADIIKNALFQKAIYMFKSQEKAIELYKTTWDKAFMADEETIEYWATPRQTGRLTRDNIEILLHSIAVIKAFYDPDIHILSDLSKLYKDEIENFKTIDELTSFINDIKEYAQIYRERILSFDSSTLFSFDDSYQRLFHVLEILQISTFHPFILSVFKNNIAEADQLLLDLESFVIRRMISKQETKSFNKLCKEFIQNPASILTRKGETTIEEFAKGLRDISNKNAALILFWVELLRRHNDPKFDTRELKFNYSLEHIMPQKWEEHWPLHEKKNVNGEPMSIEEAKKDRNDKIYWIGNMTLLTSSLNSSLRNYGFDKKVIGDGRKRGMKAYAALSITKDDIVAKFESGDNVWDEEKIIERTEKLSQEINQIWGVQGIIPSPIPVAEFPGKSATRAISVPGQAQPQSSIAFADSTNSIIERPAGEGTLSSAFALFLDQQERFINALRAYDSTVWFPLLRGKFAENVPGNWFICFVPAVWGRWKRNYGVHFDLIYARRSAELLEHFRLAIGVESPLNERHRQAFKEEVIRRIDTEEINHSGFTLTAQKGKKLLEADPTPSGSESWHMVLDKYVALHPVVHVIGEVIREYSDRGAFDSLIEFPDNCLNQRREQVHASDRR